MNPLVCLKFGSGCGIDGHFAKFTKSTFYTILDVVTVATVMGIPASKLNL